MPREYEQFQKLHSEGMLSGESFKKITAHHLNPLISVHREIKTVLYIGILLLTTGLGVLIYKNIDTIGHQVILLLMGALSTACFIYASKNKRPFSTGKVKAPNAFFDYVLLLGTLLMVSFVGYIQYQYNIFGNNYGLATLIPMIALFFIAYYFDHIGILTMAVINLGVWMGVTVTPKHLIFAGTFNSQQIINTYLTFGAILLLAGYLSQRYLFKSHFKFTYIHYGIHVTLISLLAGFFFNYDTGFSYLWGLGTLGVAALIYADAIKHHQFYFLIVSILYAYFAFSCLVVKVIDKSHGQLWALLFYYFTITPILLVVYLIRLNKRIKQHDHLQ